MTKGRSIRLFLADGVPGGIITAEIMNWTGHVMLAPRSRLPDLVKRVEAGRTGMYFLTGTDPDGAVTPLVYIGETDNVGKRLAQHSKDDSKDFWDRACIVTSKDQNLTKAHVRYLESRFIDIAKEVGRAKLINGTAPDHSLLPEADIADMEFFIEQVRIVLPVLGLEFLREAPHASAVASASLVPGGGAAAASVTDFELFSKKHDLHAKAREIDGEFVVVAGSFAQPQWIGASGHSYQSLHQQLFETGILAADDQGRVRFTADYAFKSPSAASAVVLGRTDNGRLSWCLKGTSKTYAEWQKGQIAEVAPEGGKE